MVMQVGALAIGWGMFLLLPAVPWFLFPGRRKRGAVAALLWAGVCGAWALNTYGAGAVRVLAVIVVSSSVRVVAEMAGVFGREREVRAHRLTCLDSPSCGVKHRTERMPYILVAFLATAFLLMLYTAWPQRSEALRCGGWCWSGPYAVLLQGPGAAGSGPHPSPRVMAWVVSARVHMWAPSQSPGRSESDVSSVLICRDAGSRLPSPFRLPSVPPP
ncbi:hypothetical protein Scani_79610 [Streptomyces caniferus]|uniref:Uncharacterized protein n=1 Tax=Streptomyces caniferus TaxID=285557 RepID=A0A640SJD2_9ACTN|nr:hypothetical protein Scani_79610 [Streptomyces caniferus]